MSRYFQHEGQGQAKYAIMKWLHYFMWYHMVVDQSLSRVWLLWLNGLNHDRFACPSPSPGACSNSCPLSWWCHPTISFSVAPFSCPESFPALGFFPMSQLFTSGGQSNGASFSASVLPMNIQGWSWELTDLILLSKGLSRVFSSPTVCKHQLWHSAFFTVQHSHPYTTTGKTIALTIWTFVSKVMSLRFNMLSRFIIAFLPRGECLLMS